MESCRADVINNSTEEAIAQMPSQRAMVRRIQRKRVFSHIPNPLRTSVLNVPDDLETTNRRETFYEFDSGKKDPNRFIIFITTQNLDELEFSAKWAVEGNFSVCPSFFYQLYTLHGPETDSVSKLWLIIRKAIHLRCAEIQQLSWTTDILLARWRQ